MRRSLYYNYDGLHTTEIAVISPSLPTSSIQNISKSQYQILSPLRQTLLWEQKQGTSYLGGGEGRYILSLRTAMLQAACILYELITLPELQ